MKPLLTFYGDDFTGSSAVMEILTFAGVPTVMFLDVPTSALLAKLDNIRAIGIAGVARSKNPEWMDQELPKFISALKSFGAPILHYKTCSTFDSAPQLGSIGRAIELGLSVTGAQWAPLVVGAPAIGRYQVFGTLFAAHDGVAHRLDRHPIMARHPATPMQEADLCRHLDAQTKLPKAVIDWRELLNNTAATGVDKALAHGARIVAIDAFDDVTLAATGRIIWERAQKEPSFAVGSQGVEYALVAHWKQIGLLPEALPLPAISPARPLLVVSGSCSEITSRQISAAEKHGFILIAINALKAIDPSHWDDEIRGAKNKVLAALAKGRNVLAYTARAPDDPAIAALNAALMTRLHAAPAIHARIGNGLGQLVKAARIEQKIRRAIFAGGDTSGHAMLAVGAEALMPIASLDTGVPLLRIMASDPDFDGMEVALKGGQMGDDDLFTRAAEGFAAMPNL